MSSEGPNMSSSIKKPRQTSRPKSPAAPQPAPVRFTDWASI